MKRDEPAILPETFEKMVSPWLLSLSRGDIAAVISYPHSDRQRRILNLLDHKKMQKKYLGRKYTYLFILIDMRIDPIDSVYDLESLLVRKIRESLPHKYNSRKMSYEKFLDYLKQHTKLKIVLIAQGCETLIKQGHTDILIWFTNQSRTDRIRMLLFFETNLFSRESLAVLQKTPTFQPRLHIMKLYERADALQFTKRMTRTEWDFKISLETQEKLVNACNGMFLLLKAALRCVRYEGENDINSQLNHPEMRLQLANLWNSFSQEEQSALKKIVLEEKITDTTLFPAFEYLTMTRFLEKINGTFSLTVPLFASYIKQLLFKQRMLEYKNGQIMCDGVSITDIFSSIEQSILIFLLNNPGKIVKRNDIATCIWREDDGSRYSDWAIDSHISRLRKKLVKLGFPKKYVLTIKRKGVTLQN